MRSNIIIVHTTFNAQMHELGDKGEMRVSTMIERDKS